MHEPRRSYFTSSSQKRQARQTTSRSEITRLAVALAAWRRVRERGVIRPPTRRGVLALSAAYRRGRNKPMKAAPLHGLERLGCACGARWQPA